MYSFEQWKSILGNLAGETLMPAQRLFELAEQVDHTLHIVEVGSYCGKAALTMAAGAQNGKGAHVFDIDTWGLNLTDARWRDINLIKNLGYLIDRAEALNLLGQITPLRGYAEEISRILKWNIGLLFIDGGHDRASLQRDMDCWLPQVAPGGYVLFHDYRYPDSPDVAPLLDAFYEQGLASGEWCGRQIIEPLEKTWTLEIRRCPVIGRYDDGDIDGRSDFYSSDNIE
jgi:hypothetical protein